jgi:hypothetical protein
MVSEKTKLAVTPWLPAIFCAVLYVITLAQAAASGTAGLPTVYMAFMPMCFYFVGAAVLQTRKEVVELRKQVANLRNQLG